MHTPAQARMRTHTQICNIYCFLTATMFCEHASVLRYTCIACLVGIAVDGELRVARRHVCDTLSEFHTRKCVVRYVLGFFVLAKLS